MPEPESAADLARAILADPWPTSACRLARLVLAEAKGSLDELDGSHEGCPYLAMAMPPALFCTKCGWSNHAEVVDLLRRALKNHDRITAALRAGTMRPPFKAIDDMQQVKAGAAAMGCYPKATDVLR